MAESREVMFAYHTGATTPACRCWQRQTNLLCLLVIQAYFTVLSFHLLTLCSPCPRFFSLLLRLGWVCLACQTSRRFRNWVSSRYNHRAFLGTAASILLAAKEEKMKKNYASPSRHRHTISSTSPCSHSSFLPSFLTHLHLLPTTKGYCRWP